MQLAAVEEPHVDTYFDALRAVQRDLRRQLREAQRAAREARLSVRRTKITDPPEVVEAARRHFAAGQEAVENATKELEAIQRERHALSLQRLTDLKTGMS